MDVKKAQYYADDNIVKISSNGAIACVAFEGGTGIKDNGVAMAIKIAMALNARGEDEYQRGYAQAMADNAVLGGLDGRR